MVKTLRLMAVFLVMGLAVTAAKAANIANGTLLDNVSLVTQLDHRGTTRIVFLDTLLLIGSHHGESLLHLDVGFSGDTNPETDEPQAVNYLAGAHFRLDPFINDFAHYPDHWKFLRAIRHGPGGYYDFRDEEWYASYNIGLSFDLNPKE